MSNIERLNSEINDRYLVNLIEHASEINTNLDVNFIRGHNFQNLINESERLEPIISLTTKLDQCIDDPSKFNEANDLLELIDHVYKKHGHQIPLIEAIHKQSERQREYLVANLSDRLEHLKESSKDEVISIVNYLLRFGNFSDRNLRLKYLQARDNWFNNACEEKSASFDDVVSVYCRGLPMIFDEYKSIFGDKSELLDRKLMRLSTTDPSHEDGAIINSWILLKTSIFIASLEVYLKTINQSAIQTPTMIGDTMQKCFKLTGWLATIGFDFSSQLRPLFSKALIEEVKSSVERATSKFESAFATTASKSIESLLLPIDDEILRISNMRPEEQIPKSIEHYPIFRVYCLYLIDSLRWLQTTKSILSPTGLCLDTYTVLNASLTRVIKALAMVLNMDNNSTHPILSKIAISFVTEVLPFVANYCERLFPEKIVLSAIGISKSEYKTIIINEPERLRNFQLDLKHIADPLKSTMPALMQTFEN